MINRYKTFLMRQELAANTIRSYVWTVTDFLERYPEVTRENLLACKGSLMEHHKPQTVNLRLQAINKYLEYMKKDRLKMSFVKVPCGTNLFITFCGVLKNIDGSEGLRL